MAGETDQVASTVKASDMHSAAAQLESQLTQLT